MTSVPADLLARVPTLTEVVERNPLPDLGDDPLEAPEPEKTAVPELENPDAWVDQVMDRLGPQVDALVAGRLRDLLAPAIQDAVDEAVERLREPLVASVQARLRDVLEVELRQVLGHKAAHPAEPRGFAEAPPTGASLRIP